MKVKDFFEKLSSLIKGKMHHRISEDDVSKNYAVKSANISLWDVPFSIVLVIKKYGWRIFFHKALNYQKLVFERYSEKIIKIINEVKFTLMREGYKKTLVRSLNFILYGKGVLLKKELILRPARLKADSLFHLIQKEIGDNLKKWDDYIVVISHDATKTGAPLTALNVVKSLNKDFNKKVITILIQGGPLEEEFKKYGNVFNLNCTSLTSLSLSEKTAADFLFKKLSEAGANKCICNTVLSGLFLPMLNRYNFSTVGLIHEQAETIKQYNFIDATEKMIHYADKIVFSSNFVRDDFENNFTKFQNEILIRPQGIYLSNIFDGEETVARRMLRKKLGLKDSAKIIFACGFANERKGADLFFEVAEKISRDAKDLQCHFVWMGEWDESLRDKLMKIANEKGFSDRIILNGFENDPSLFFAGSDIFLLTSRQDPFPSVVLNSMDVGVPVVAFERAGGSPEILANQQGILVPYLDVDSMEKEIINLLKDEQLYGIISEKSKKAIKEKFIFKDYVKFLLEQISDNGEIVNSRKTDDLRVSVIVPNYNYEQYLTERLSSIVNQTRKPFEIIFLDDNSGDNSLELAEKFLSKTDIPYKIIKNETNAGCFKQWAKGVREAKGDLIWIAEADDSCEANFLEILVSKFSDPEVGLAFSQSLRMDSDGVKRESYLSYLESIPRSGNRWRRDFINAGEDEIRKYLIVKNTIVNASAVLMRRDLLAELGDNIGGGLAQAGDWYTYVQILSKSKIAFSAFPLNFHRYHQNNIVSRSGSNTEPRSMQLLSETFFIHEFILSGFEVSKKCAMFALEHIKLVCRNSLHRELEIIPEFADKLKMYKGKPKRVLFFSTNDGWGGSEVACAKLAQSFFADGWRTALVMSKHNPRPTILNEIKAEKNIEFFERNALDYGKSIRLANFINGFDPDIIFISQGHVFEGAELMKWCQSNGYEYANFIPLVTEHHISIIKPSKECVEENKNFLKSSKMIFSDNQQAQKTMEKIFGVPFDNFSVMRNGFDVQYAQPMTWSNAMDDAYKLIFLGRFHCLHKGLDMLLEVLAMKKWKERPLQIMAFGEGEDRPMMEEYIKKHNIKSFNFCGYTDNLEAEIKKFHGIIFPSRMEGTPISLIDAMLCNRMAVVTPVGGMPDLVIDGQSGFVANDASANGIDECLERAWQKRSEWKNLGENAGKRVKEVVSEFPHEQCIKTINDILI